MSKENDEKALLKRVGDKSSSERWKELDMNRKESWWEIIWHSEEKKVHQPSQIKVTGKKISLPNKCAKLLSLLTWNKNHKVMNQNTAPKEPGHFQNLCVLNLLNCALRLTAFTSWLNTITGKYLPKQVSSCHWGFQFGSADFVHVNDPFICSGVTQPLCTSLPACSQSQTCFSLQHNHPNVNVITQSGRTGINSHISHIFWEVGAAERHMYRKERMVKEKEHGWSPISCLIEIRSSN